MAPVGLSCFHHAGGGSASFHALRRALTDVATSPGRESRRAEPRHVDADSCVHALADELEEQLTRPHVPLGHSMGALLAYSLSQQRISRGLRLPEAVIVASCRAPRQQARAENLQSMDDYRRDSRWHLQIRWRPGGSTLYSLILCAFTAAGIPYSVRRTRHW